MTTDEPKPDAYNYTSFPADSDIEEFRRFPDIVNVGTTAPDGRLIDSDSSEPVALRDITRRGLTILEFGSLT